MPCSAVRNDAVRHPMDGPVRTGGQEVGGSNPLSPTRKHRLFFVLAMVRPGELVVAGSELTPAVCEVVDVVQKPADTIVHLRTLPGSVDRYRDMVGHIGA